MKTPAAFLTDRALLVAESFTRGRGGAVHPVLLAEIARRQLTPIPTTRETAPALAGK